MQTLVVEFQPQSRPLAAAHTSQLEKLLQPSTCTALREEALPTSTPPWNTTHRVRDRGREGGSGGCA